MIRNTLVIAIVLCASTTTLHADIILIQPSADTTLTEAAPNNNMGGFNLFLSGTDGMGRRRRGLLDFDIASSLPAGATITAATLQISVTAPDKASSGFGLHRVLTDWNEGIGGGSPQGEPALPGETTWNNIIHPAGGWTIPGGSLGTDIAALSSASATIAVAGVYDWTGLAADVQSMLDNPNSDFGWALISEAEATSGTARRFESRETGGFAPVLTVEFTPVPEPSSLLLVLFGVGFYLSRRR